MAHVSSTSSTMQVDTEKAIVSMQKKRGDFGSLQPYCEIYNVPEQLRKLNPNAYAPQAVSIGPLHYHKDRNLPITEARKFYYLNRLLIGCEKKFQVCVREVASDHWVKSARECYPDTKCFANEEFIEMMALDGCFILGYLNVMDKQKQLRDIFVSNTSWQGEIMADMVKLENQLPLFVLRDLYAAVFGEETSFSSFIYKNLIRLLARSVSPKFDSADITTITLPSVSTGEADDGAKHFLDFLRRLIISSSSSSSSGTPVIQPDDDDGQEDIQGTPANHCCCHDFLGCLIIPSTSEETETTSTISNEQKKCCTCICPSGVQFGNLACWTTGSYERQNGSGNWEPLNETLVRLRYSASQLKTAGVKFQHKKATQASSVLDINFDKENGVLSIPTFRIINDTELVLRNLIVFEQDKPAGDRLISAYAAFMDDLTNTAEDVNLLTEKGIIIDNLGNPENVAALFSNITRNVSIWNAHHFSGVISDLEGYYNQGCNRFMADLSQHYFRTPWSKVSFPAALFVTILTLIQTVCSILQSIY